MHKDEILLGRIGERKKRIINLIEYTSKLHLHLHGIIVLEGKSTCINDDLCVGILLCVCLPEKYHNFSGQRPRSAFPWPFSSLPTVDPVLI